MPSQAIIIDRNKQNGFDSTYYNSFKHGNETHQDFEFSVNWNSLFGEDGRFRGLEEHVSYIKFSNVYPHGKFILDNPPADMTIEENFFESRTMAILIFMLHNFRNLITKIFPKRHFDKKTSFYLANLFFDYEWKQITVDDLIPVSSKQTAYFTTTSTDEFWPILLEKALSKGIGSYI